MIDVIKYKNWFLGAAAILVSVSIALMVVFGFQWSIDFRGGSLWQLHIPGADPSAVRDFFETELGANVSSISYDSASETYSVAFEEITDAERQEELPKIAERFPGAEELDFWSISPAVSEEMKQKALTAILLVLVGISAYIAFAFRKVSQPIQSWKYGIVTLISLAHDVIVPAGLFALLGHLIGASVDTNFVVALLVVMSFSVHDTIVVFDRVRENLLKYAGKETLSATINRSVNETLHRSINTSLTLVIVLIALYFLGPIGLKLFVLTILVGTVAGTYSSIFVGSPLLAVAERLSGKKK